MMKLRSKPGEWIYHRVWKHGETITITHHGKEIAQICPVDNIVIDSKGRGTKPLTYRRPELLRPEKGSE